tara:strand:- start:946 stop:1146 length:201 start_codon:yes stop_codon:yes gene_type:complete
MEHLTVNSVTAELDNINSYDEVLELGTKVKNAIRAGINTPFLPLDVFDQTDDKIKARSFMLSVICN